MTVAPSLAAASRIFRGSTGSTAAAVPSVAIKLRYTVAILALLHCLPSYAYKSSQLCPAQRGP